MDPPDSKYNTSAAVSRTSSAQQSNNKIQADDGARNSNSSSSSGNSGGRAAQNRIQSLARPGGSGGGGRRSSSSSSINVFHIVLTVICTALFFHVRQSPLALLGAASDCDCEKNKKVASSSTTASTTASVFDPIKDVVLIDKTAVKSQQHSKARLEQIKGLTVVNYEKFITGKPGSEHYSLLNYLVDLYGDNRHVADVGTRYCASALALGSSSSRRSPVWTFDLPTSTERNMAFRGKSEADWQTSVKAAGIDITFHNVDLLKVSDEDFTKYFSTWLVLVDTFHHPDLKPFEREYLVRLRGIGFKGLLLLDDIYQTAEMKRWWKELEDNADAWGYTVHDLTSVGHVTGTGLLDFSGRVKVVE